MASDHYDLPVATQVPAPLPICIVGGGSIGMRHVDCALTSDKVALTAIVEAHAPRRAELLEMGLPAVADILDVPNETSAAVVATPTSNHAEVALECLDRGWAVLVEKPLTEKLAEADALCERAVDLGLPLLTGHHRRCHPFVAHAREHLTQIGGLVALQGIWSLRKHDSYFDVPWRCEVGAGPIMTNLSHEIDLLHCLAGPITQVAAMTSNTTRNLDVEDTASVSMRFENGAIGNFIMSDAGASPWAFEATTGENPAIKVRGDDPLRFIGTQGAFGFPSLQRWGACAGSPPDWRHPLAWRRGPELEKTDGIAVQLDRFAAVVHGQPDPLLATGSDGRRTMLVLEAIRQAALTGTTRQVAG